MPSEGPTTRSIQSKTRRPGFAWRTLAWQDRGQGERVEQRYQPKEKVEFDELVIDDWFHMEMMSDHEYWLQVGDARIWVIVRGGTVTTTIEREEYGEPC